MLLHISLDLIAGLLGDRAGFNERVEVDHAARRHVFRLGAVGGLLAVGRSLTVSGLLRHCLALILRGPRRRLLAIGRSLSAIGLFRHRLTLILRGLLRGLLAVGRSLSAIGLFRHRLTLILRGLLRGLLAVGRSLTFRRLLGHRLTLNLRGLLRGLLAVGRSLTILGLPGHHLTLILRGLLRGLLAIHILPFILLRRIASVIVQLLIRSLTLLRAVGLLAALLLGCLLLLLAALLLLGASALIGSLAHLLALLLRRLAAPGIVLCHRRNDHGGRKDCGRQNCCKNLFHCGILHFYYRRFPPQYRAMRVSTQALGLWQVVPSMIE